MLRAQVMIDGKPHQSLALSEGLFLVGRAAHAELQLDVKDVSREHVRLVVTGGTVRVENLSKYGAALDGARFSESVPLVAGQTLEIGKHVTISLECDADHSTPTRDRVEVATRGPAEVSGSQVAVTTRPRDATATAPKITRDPAASPAPSRTLSVADSSEAGDDEQNSGTRMIHTRAAGPQELEFLRERGLKQPRQRLSIGLALGAAVLVLALVFYPRQPPPETEFTWPTDKEGNYMDAFVPSPSGGLADGRYDLAFPGLPGWTSEKTDGGVSITCRIGREGDVPLRLHVSEESDPRFLAMSKEDALHDWMQQQVTGKDGVWNFDRPTSDLRFFGNEHGVPFLHVAYERDDQRAWFGCASVFRHGATRIVLLAEVPAAERTRAEAIVNATFFLDPSSAFERAWWEGQPVRPNESLESLLAEARGEMRRMAPATWVELESMLMRGLTLATRNADTRSAAELQKLLVQLRELQAQWFNGQQLAVDSARAAGTEEKSKQIVEFAKAVFSSPEDNRYFIVRKW